ncbi:M48 family metalloprotease [Oleisolibacter albus]|uniref:M48 family metalloprotease n=1 Tax=Oleisolibacter albus TaxID=2171757 RepID=UPI001EFE933F|nr:M48 family metalloprotease [Oleisolibacter albus]
MPLSAPLPRSRRSRFRLCGVAGGLAALLLLAACSTNPATGERQFAGLMSAEQEKAVGAEQDPQVTAEFGGAYKDQAVQAYVDRMGQTLARATERPEIQYRFTVLDSPIVNAFALPGGYVYVTRGLMALANNEAQLAGVVGHEIGHVTARHTAERYSQGTVAGVLASAAGVFLGQEAAQLGQAVGQGVLAGFSRGQELQADGLGIRYMAAAGYDPRQMSGFLSTMGRQAQLDALLAGKPGSADQFSYLQTHPPTGERVEQASTAAAARPGRDWTVGTESYLRLLDGMIYGDSPDHGLVRGTTFLHPSLGFRFQVPDGFQLVNGEQAVLALGPGDARIIFDAAPSQGAASPEAYLRTVWARGSDLSGTASLSVNGMPAATGTARVSTRSGLMDVRLVAIRWSADTYYRFLFVTPPTATAGLDAAFRRTVEGFRPLTDADRQASRPYRLRIVAVKPGETVADFVRRMPFTDYAEERFRVLNDIAPGTALQPGQLVKLVVQG